MIDAISKVQKIASGSQGGVILNSSLPVSIKVIERSGFNRYNLKFGNKTLSTKSQKSLKIGAEYWGEIEGGKENIIIKNLFEKPNLKAHATLDNGLELIEKLVNSDDLEWFYEYVRLNLVNATTKDSYQIYTDMLFALQKNVIYIPFVYGENLGVFQMQKDIGGAKIYLIFSNFSPLFFHFRGSKIYQIATIFEKMARFLRDKFSCDVSVANVREIYAMQSSIIDFKG